MGSTLSRNKQPQGQFPYPFPPQPYGFQPPGFGYPPNMGYNPYMPEPEPRRKRRRKSRSRSEEMYPGGYVPYQQARSMQQAAEPAFQPQVAFQPSATAASNPAPRRQVHTPYPSRMAGLAESEMGGPAPGHAARPMSTSHGDGDISRILQPMTPANPGVYGPTDRHHMPRSPLTNPLPPPPRDLYDLSPYKQLLNLPQTTALLTAAYSNQVAVGPGVKRSKTGLFGGNGKKSGGLFRSLSSAKKHESNKPDVHFVPVFVGGGNGATANGSATPSAAGPSTQTFPPPTGSQPAAQAWTGTGHPPHHHTPGSQMPIVPPVIFTQLSPGYQGFLNHAPYRVMYQNQTYPTATHLYEALKFLHDSNGNMPPGWTARPEIATSIRNTKNASDVYAQSANYRHLERPDWGQVFVRMMEDVLLNKFRQHPNLRTLLMGTAPAELIYRDADDQFWSDGRRPEDPPDGFPGPGENQLGKALMKVRDRLMAEYTA